jgi:MYXO-CTERM domain-containing protein
VVAILTAVNYVGIREGKLTQNFFTSSSAVAGAIVVAGFFSPTGPGGCGCATAGEERSPGTGAGLAMIFVFHLRRLERRRLYFG